MPTTALPTLDGSGTGSLADYEGKWVLINVWASWCGPCRDEAPALESFYRDHRGDDFEVLGIDTQETDDGGRGFVDEFELTYPQLHDGDGRLRRRPEDHRRAGELPRRPRRHPRRSPSTARSTTSFLRSRSRR